MSDCLLELSNSRQAYGTSGVIFVSTYPSIAWNAPPKQKKNRNINIPIAVFENVLKRVHKHIWRNRTYFLSPLRQYLLKSIGAFLAVVSELYSGAIWTVIRGSTFCVVDQLAVCVLSWLNDFLTSFDEVFVTKYNTFNS